jgi:hypothetical protein
MDTKPTTLIEAWFRKHDGDGEFTQGLREIPYSVIGATPETGSYFFTTKPAVVSCLISEQDPASEFGMIGRYGLPCDDDIPWIAHIIGQRPLYFLGDMDSVDLMVFAWLRLKIGVERITHLGINDRLVQEIGPPFMESLTIPCGESEREALATLRQVAPDLIDAIGGQCSRLLERNQKIELEALMYSKERAASILAIARQQTRRQ